MYMKLDDLDPLSAVLDGLIKQNLALGQRQLALQATCSVLIAELCLLSPDPDQKLSRLNAELNGAAMGIADDFATRFDISNSDTREITMLIETITRIAEETVLLKTRRSPSTAL